MGRIPNSEINEVRVLSRLLGDSRRDPAAHQLTPDDFFSPQRRRLFIGWQSISRRLADYDDVMVLNEAKKLWQGADGQELADLQAEWQKIVVSQGTPNLTEDIETLKEYTKRRKLLDIAEKITKDAGSGEHRIDVLKIVDKLATLQNNGRTVQSMEETMTESLKVFETRWNTANKGLVGLTSTFAEVDRVTGGFMAGEIILDAGRPGSGKTTVMLQQAVCNAANYGKKCVFFSLEMQKYEIAEKLVSQQTSIPAYLVSKPKTDEQKEEIRKAMATIREMPLRVIDDIFALDDIISTCWFVKESWGLDAVFIDYMQLIDVDKQFQSDNSRIAYISRHLKMLAQQLRIPLIIGSQLNRASESRADQEPTLADLRDSGSLEQDASIVIAMHNHKVSVEKEEKRVTDGYLLLKNRRGPAGFRKKLEFVPDMSTFLEQ